MAQGIALVVDDSKSARFALRKCLESHSYKVDTAESAEEALRYLAQTRPDVIFLDHVMPGADGFDVLRRIKGDAQTVTIPVVICSSNEGEDFGLQARSKGAADVLQKPPRADQLARVLDRLQKARSALQAAPAAVRPAPPASAKVAPIREPEVAIEQAVMKALRSALPAVDAAAAPALKAVEPVATSSTTETPDHRQTALREQMETRLRKITQELYAELGDLKARVAHLDGAQAGARPDPAIARELAALRAQFEELRQRVDGSVQAIEKQLREALATLRQVAADEAHAAAERSVMNAAARISNQFAEGILKAVGKR